MGGAVEVLHVLVGAGAGVAIAYQHGDRGPQGSSLEESGDDFGSVFLLARGGEPALARPAPVEVGLNLLDVQGQARRAAVHHDPHSTAVGFAEGCDPEDFSEAAAHIRPLARTGARVPGKTRGRLRPRLTASIP